MSSEKSNLASSADNGVRNKEKPSNDLPVENIRQTKAKHLSQGPFPLRVAKVFVDAFQGTGKRRPEDVQLGSTGSCNDGSELDLRTIKTEHVRLITIGLSHYCEKVRWALDLVEADPESPMYYTEDAHPPAFASFVTVPVSRGEASMTPMLVFDDDSRPTLYDSTEIMKSVTPFLYPRSKAEEIEEFEEYLDANLGPTVRCLAYNELLSPENQEVLGKFATAHTSKVETILFKNMLGKGLSDGMRKAMTVTPEKAEKSLSEVRSVFENVSQRLSDGRQYLFDENDAKFGFTAADLTFAALASPLIMPKELLQLQIRRDLLPSNLSSLVEELSSTPAGQHAITMYHKHRFGKGAQPKSGLNCAMAFHQVVPKSIGRNRIPMSLYGAAAAAVAGVAVVMRSRL